MVASQAWSLLLKGRSMGRSHLLAAYLLHTFLPIRAVDFVPHLYSSELASMGYTAWTRQGCPSLHLRIIFLLTPLVLTLPKACGPGLWAAHFSAPLPDLPAQKHQRAVASLGHPGFALASQHCPSLPLTSLLPMKMPYLGGGESRKKGTPQRGGVGDDSQ